MKIKKILVLLGATICFSGCFDSPTSSDTPSSSSDPITPTNTAVYPTEIKAEGPLDNKMFVGTTYIIKFEVLPSNATNKKVTFSTNDEKIATVSENGEIKAVSVGQVKITIKSVSKESVTSVLDISVKKVVDDF